MKSPTTIGVEISRNCNLKCSICPRRKGDNGNLSPSTFNTILDQFPELEKLYFIGGGEPLLNPYLNDYLGLAKKRNIKVGINTNGMLVDEAIIDSWKHQGPLEVYVSLDSFNQELLDKLRPGASVEKIKTAIDLFHKAGIPTGVNFLIQPENRTEEDLVLKTYQYLPVKTKVVYPLYTYQKSWFLNEAPEVLKEKTTHCGSVPHITIEGDVFICPYIPTFSRDGWFVEEGYGQAVGIPTNSFKMGNLLEQPFMDIWNNEKYTSWRASFQSVDGPLPLSAIRERNPKKIQSSIDYCKICPIRWGLACEA